MRVLICHQVDIMRLDALDDLFSLDAVAVLEQTLQDSAAVVLKDQLLVLRADQLEALVDYRVLLLVGYLHLSLLDQQLVVIYLKNWH